MDGWNTATFGEVMADYDSHDWAVGTDEVEASEFLAGFGAGGRALELGVGSGRVAIPLARRGLRVVGIEASASMAAQLKAKLERETIGTVVESVVGDFTDVSVPGPFDLVYCVFNTFFLLLTQEDQVRCFREVARVLRPGGVFVIQASVPEGYLFADRQAVRTLSIGLEHTVIVAVLHDPVNQRVDRQQVVMRATGNSLYPMAYRYAWPAELDLMALLAGMPLDQRWGGWQRQPFTGTGGHISVYSKPAGRESGGPQ